MYCAFHNVKPPYERYTEPLNNDAWMWYESTNMYRAACFEAGQLITERVDELRNWLVLTLAQ